jgi:hypothetical protein
MWSSLVELTILVQRLCLLQYYPEVILMSKQRKIVDARKDKNGNISHVLLDGNQNYTPVDKVVEMADQGKIENAHPVRPKGRAAYLRTNPDNQSSNNLDNMARS